MDALHHGPEPDRDGGFPALPDPREPRPVGWRLRIPAIAGRDLRWRWRRTAHRLGGQQVGWRQFLDAEPWFRGSAALPSPCPMFGIVWACRHQHAGRVRPRPQWLLQFVSWKFQIAVNI